MNIGHTIYKRAAAFLLAVLFSASCLFLTAEAGTRSSSAAETGAQDGEQTETAASSVLGAAQGYNLICFGDFAAGRTEIEGKSAVGGSVSVPGGAARFLDGLVWGGDSGSDWKVPGGSSGKELYVSDSALGSFRENKTVRFSGMKSWKTENDLKKKCGFTFSELQDQMTSLSDSLTELAGDSGSGYAGESAVQKEQDGTSKLILTSKEAKDGLCLFSTSAEELSNCEEVNLDIPEGATAVIDVTGETAVLPRVRRLKDGKTKSLTETEEESLLWNFSEAKEFSARCNTTIEGSVLAPGADFKNGAAFEGTLIVGSVSAAQDTRDSSSTRQSAKSGSAKESSSSVSSSVSSKPASTPSSSSPASSQPEKAQDSSSAAESKSENPQEFSPVSSQATDARQSSSAVSSVSSQSESTLSSAGSNAQEKSASIPEAEENTGTSSTVEEQKALATGALDRMRAASESSDGSAVSSEAGNSSAVSSAVSSQPEKDQDVSSTDSGGETGEVQGKDRSFRGLSLLLTCTNADGDAPAAAKTVHVNSWDDRTYDITLSITAKSEIETTKVPCDVVLVLDRSGSMAEPYCTPISGEPDRNKTYYVYQYGDYQEVQWHEYDPWNFRHHSGWYYSNSWGYRRVDPSNTTFYSRSSETKLQALKDAANHFADSVAAKEDGSRVAVVSFASNVQNNTHGLLSAKDDKTAIHSAVNSLSAYGATYADEGMKVARNIFDSDSTPPAGRQRVVILFTDGEPGQQGFSNSYGYETAASTINQSAVLKAKYGTSASSDVTFHGYWGDSASGDGCGATVYTVGIFSGILNDDLLLVNDYMTRTASPGNFMTVSDSSSLDNIFQTISQEVGNISSAKITDVLDPNFELTEDAKTELESSGATVSGGRICWAEQEIPVEDDGSPGWTETFTVKAKDSYIGGNAVPTNADGSGIAYGEDQFVSFPQPKVNVKAKLEAQDNSVTIFRGENIPAEAAQSCILWDDSRVTSTWRQTGSDHVISGFPSDVCPDDSTSYLLDAAFDPGEPTSESTENTDGHVCGETGKDGKVNASATLTVHVVKGEIDLTKTIDALYPAPAEVSAKQSFVFRITRSETQDGPAADTFYEVITPDQANHGKTRKITGLKEGYYTVTEESGSWRYTKSSVTDNDGAGDGKVYLGRTDGGFAGVQTGTQQELSSVPDCPRTVAFQNKLANPYWFGDTTVAVNTVTFESVC